MASTVYGGQCVFCKSAASNTFYLSHLAHEKCVEKVKPYSQLLQAIFILQQASQERTFQNDIEIEQMVFDSLAEKVQDYCNCQFPHCKSLVEFIDTHGPQTMAQLVQAAAS